MSTITNSLMMVLTYSQKGEVEQLHETDPRHRVFKEQHFYSIRKDAFEKMTPNSIFKDSDRHTKSIPKIQGDKLIFTSANTSETETFTRTSGKELVKYIQFRNRGFALRSAYLWNTDVIEKLSSNGVNYATLQDNYAANIFDHLFNSVMIYHSVGDDRNIRYIFKVLLRENEGFASGSGFESLSITLNDVISINEIRLSGNREIFIGAIIK